MLPGGVGGPPEEEPVRIELGMLAQASDGRVTIDRPDGWQSGSSDPEIHRTVCRHRLFDLLTLASPLIRAVVGARN